MWGVLFGFLIGALAVLAAEAVVLLKVLQWLRRKGKPQHSEGEPGRDLDGEQSLLYAKSKKGIVWLLETADQVPLATSDQSTSKVLKEQKIRKGIIEVFPSKKYARIENQLLILEDTNGCQEASIQLKDCAIMAVSGSNLPSRKWAKRYPLKVESKKSPIYRGSKTFYLFLETSWEKEAWCKALRLASCSDRKKWEQFDRLTRDFHLYISSLNAEYPSFLKPSEFTEATDKVSKIDASSRVRYFLKRLAKKAAKGTAENKTSTIWSSNRGETKFGEKLHSFQDTASSTGLVKTSSTTKFSSNSVQDLHPTIPTISHSSSESQASLSSDLAPSERLAVDEGTLCWNLLFSRLFFDAKRSTNINSFIKERIQKSLSNMRTPSYIGSISCTHLDLGNIPPHVRSMRVLPMDLNDVWAFEVDVEYSGGILLDIETRLEVREPDFQRGLVDRSLEPSTVEVTSDLLEGFEHYKNQLKCSSDTTEKMENNIVEDKPDVLKSSKSTSWASTYVSRWKAIVHSVAEQVSQVPLSLRIRIASLRGTLRLHIKPPPSDQLWFGFTSMPDIDWNLDSSVGDHKIASSHIALLIGNRFKSSIQEVLVLPNCESVCIPWMLAEKDDWVPRNVAPFIWINQEVGDLAGDNPLSLDPGETKLKQGSSANMGARSNSDSGGDSVEKRRETSNSQPAVSEPIQEVAGSDSSSPMASTSGDLCPTVHNAHEEDLKQPLLRHDDVQDNCSRRSSTTSPEDFGNIVADHRAAASDEDAKPKKGRRERMRELGKRMGEKLEEKRRHLEERSRHIVDKMRENARQ